MPATGGLRFAYPPYILSAMALDTLKLARRLAAAGMPTEQADGVAAAIADGVAEQLATKTDIAEVRTEIAGLRAEVKADLAELRTEIAEVRSELRTEFARVRTEMAELRTSMIQWIVGAVLLNWAAMAGLVIAIWNLSHR